MYPSPNGRPPLPLGVLACAVVLQTLHNLSEIEPFRNYGVTCDGRPHAVRACTGPPPLLANFRHRLARSAYPEQMFDVAGMLRGNTGHWTLQPWTHLQHPLVCFPARFYRSSRLAHRASGTYLPALAPHLVAARARIRHLEEGAAADPTVVSRCAATSPSLSWQRIFRGGKRLTAPVDLTLMAEPFQCGHCSGGGTAAATHEAPVPLREVFEVSTHRHRSLAGSPSCRT